MIKAVGLLSGGLDSSLAVRLVLDQGIEVYALSFITPFCTCTKRGCQTGAREIAERFGIELKVVVLKEEYIELVKHPKYGYGKNMNPCIDCRIFMFSSAKAYMEEIGAAFVFTGEVVGERPMSQRLRAMQIIEKGSGLEGRLLRPLSAKLLPPTIPEKEGLVDREKLLAISGRSRKPQMALAKEFGITHYPCPAGGCKLTDPQYARRFREALEHNEDSLVDIQLLSIGRHFRLQSGAKVIVGRNRDENGVLRNLVHDGDVVLEVSGFLGPTTILKKCKGSTDIEIAAGLCVRYSDYKDEKPVAVAVGENRTVFVPALPDELLNEIRVK